MNLYSRPLFFLLWLAVMLAQGYVFAILVGHQAYRKFPAFTAFLAMCVSRGLLMFYIGSYHTALYHPVYWSTYVPELIILVALVLEVFHVLFHPLNTLPKHTVESFIQAIIALAVVAILFTARFPGAGPSAWMTFARAIDQIVSWVLCGIFAFIVLFAKYFGISWRHRVYGIATGYLLYLAVDVAVITAVSQYHLPPFSPVRLFDMFAFILACVVWVRYFSKPEEPGLLPNLEQMEKIQGIVENHAIAIAGVTSAEPSGSDKPWGGENR